VAGFLGKTKAGKVTVRLAANAGAAPMNDGGGKSKIVVRFWLPADIYQQERGRFGRSKSGRVIGILALARVWVGRNKCSFSLKRLFKKTVYIDGNYHEAGLFSPEAL
jgi:hypothetical protein